MERPEFLSDEEYSSLLPVITNFVAKRGQEIWAEDIAQEAMISYAQYPQTARNRGLLFAIARNRTIDWNRRDLSCPITPIDHNIRKLENNDYRRFIENGTNIADTQMDITDSMMRLKDQFPREMMALLLFYWEGYDCESIADIMDVTRDIVKHLLLRGRRHLKASLQNTYG